VVLRAFTDIADKEGFDFTTNLNAYSTPVLFLYGSNNRSYGLSFAQKEAAFFPHASIAAIEGTGHEMIYFKWNLVHHIVLNYLHPLR
jgi:proline iminopeptidase